MQRSRRQSPWRPWHSGRHPPAARRSAANATSVAEVVVTGSHIRDGEAPVVNVQTLDRAQLEETGASQIADIIRSIPSNTGTTLYNETGQLTGTAQISLRGLGFSSTLTLLNGRRAGVTPLSDKSGADFVDINQFPLAMVQRIDVLKDGASAIYGSEAVAGVVNLVTRKGFEGFEVSANVRVVQQRRVVAQPGERPQVRRRLDEFLRHVLFPDRECAFRLSLAGGARGRRRDPRALSAHQQHWVPHHVSARHHQCVGADCDRCPAPCGPPIRTA